MSDASASDASASDPSASDPVATDPAEPHPTGPDGPDGSDRARTSPTGGAGVHEVLEPVEAVDGAPTPADPATEPGRVVAVWGPPGAPGRTTVATELAALLGRPGAPALLVDADTVAPSAAQRLGLLDEVSGLLAAARAADAGRLDLAALSALAPVVHDGLRVLTGLPSADRWPELRPQALGRALDLCRRLAGWTVVDVAAALEQDEELSYDTAAPRRNGAAVTALQRADVVVAVGAGDVVGLRRLVAALPAARELAGTAPLVVVNRVRPGAVRATTRPGRRSAAGGDSARRAAEQAVREGLQRWAGVADPVLLPDDPAALDLAGVLGRTLGECAPRSPFRLALAGLATRLGGPASGPTAGARRRRAADRRTAVHDAAAVVGTHDGGVP